MERQPDAVVRAITGCRMRVVLIEPLGVERGHEGRRALRRAIANDLLCPLKLMKRCVPELLSQESEFLSESNADV
jgi:hypothetical protein